jgi:hypothetical protein
VQISSLDSSTQAYAALQAPPPPPAAGGPGRQFEQSLATTLGVGTSDLESARQSGETLAQFAQSKGISQDTLISAVKSSMAANAPQGAPALSDDQLTSMATDMVDRTPGSGGHHHHHGGGGVKLPDDSLLQALQGTSSADGTSGTSITDILQQLLSSSSSTDTSGTSSDGTSSDSSLQNLLDQINGSSSTTYGADGNTPDLSGSLGLDAQA